MEEEADAEALLPDAIEEFDDQTQQMPEWSGYLITAWQSLRHDRRYFDTGGCGGIYYASISAYAHDHGLVGDLFPDFETYLRVMDDEYVAFSAEKAKEAADKAAKSENP